MIEEIKEADGSLLDPKDTIPPIKDSNGKEFKDAVIGFFPIINEGLCCG